MSPPEVLDCTLRDGSYPIHYQFTTEDTALLVAGLQEAGVRRIEVGHGMGLGASRPEYGVAAATDEEYLEAAASATTTARFGVFFIPGIADRRHLDLAARYGAGFIRIGTNITETESGFPFIRRAKEMGLEVWANLMKTYAVSIDELVRRARQLDECGVDIIAIVDSAGGMLPRDVAAATRAVRNEVRAAVGFHGHNNLQLALGNCVAALEAGATFLDTSLRGLGRSCGNAQTEVLAMVLDRMGLNPGLDISKLLELGERYIEPMARGRGSDAIGATCGYALFHSSYLKYIFDAAREFHIDPKELIVKVSAEDRINVSREAVRRAAAELQRRTSQFRLPALVPSNSSSEADLPIVDEARRAARALKSMSAKAGKPSVFTVAPLWPDGKQSHCRFSRVTQCSVVANAEVGSAEEAVQVASAVDGLVDVVAIAVQPGCVEWGAVYDRIHKSVHHSRVLTYRHVEALVQAADAYLAQVALGHHTQVAIAGCGEISWKLALKVAQRGATVGLICDKPKTLAVVTALNELLKATGNCSPIQLSASLSGLAGRIDVLVAAGDQTASIDDGVIDALPDKAMIVELGRGALTPAALQQVGERGIPVYSIDMRAGLGAEILNILDTGNMATQVNANTVVAGVRIVADGFIGAFGDVIVDSVRSPARIIGVADGSGHLVELGQAPELHERVERIRQAIVTAGPGAHS